MGPNSPSWAALKPGDHLIAVYQEQTDKGQLLELVADAVGASGEAAFSIGCGQYGCALSPDEYSDSEGSFSLPRLAESLRRRRSASPAAARALDWLVVDSVALSAAIGQTSRTNPPFRVWEEAATVLLTEVPIVLVCLYDRKRLDDESMIRLFCCHPHIVIDGRVSTNPIYLGLREVSRGSLPELGPMTNALNGYDRRVELRETLRRIGSAAESLPPEELLDIALDSMMDILRADAGVIRAADPQVSPMPVLAHRGLKPESLALAAQSRMGENMSDMVAESGEAWLVEDVSKEPRAIKNLIEREDLSSVMTLPLKSGQRVIGVLSLGVRGDRRFTEDEFKLARSVCSMFSQFLVRAVLYGEAAGQAQQMEALARATALASMPLDQGVVEALARETTRALQADSGACLFFTDGWTQCAGEPFIHGLHGARGDLGLPPDWPAEGAGDPLAPFEEALKTAIVVVRGNQWGENRILIAPIIHGGLVLGALMGARGPEAPPFDRRRTYRAATLAASMATALVNRRLAGARARQIEDVRLASRIGNRVAGILEVKEALTEAARLVVEMVGQVRVDIWLLDPDGSLRVAVSHGDIPEFSPEGSADAEGGPGTLLVQQVVETGQSAEASRRHEGNYHSRVCVPLKLGEPAIGVLEVRTVGLRPFDSDRIPALESIAEHLVATIRNGLLFEEINRSRRQLETIMGNMGEPLMVMEQGGVVSFMNIAAVRAFGEQIGRHCYEVLAGSREPCPDCPLPWDSAESWTYRYGRESADGRIFDIVASSLPTDEGHAVVAIIRDNTEERLMHNYLAQHELMSAMGEMASGIAHNFNNILTGIIGTLDDLRRHPAVDKMSPALDVIEKSAIDGADIVRRLLAATRTSEEPGQVLDIRTVIQDAIHVTRPRWKSQAERAGRVIEVVSTVDKGLTVRGQPAELRQVFINLIINAVDALPEGGRIEIEATAVDGAVEIRVSDDGIGMPKEVMARLFQPFFTTKGKMGSGLGLSTAYNILRNHDGSITVESAPAIGTTFTVTLPLCEAGPQTEAEAAAGEEPGQPGKILIVDDDRVVLEVLGALVAAGGHEVRMVGRGVEALQLLAQEPFDVVITDLGMPEMNGWEVAEAVRGVSPQTGLILLTGWGNNLGDDESNRPLVDLVMAKPVRVAELLGAVARVRRMKLNAWAGEQTA